MTAGLRLDSLSVARLGSLVVRGCPRWNPAGSGDHAGTERSGQDHTAWKRLAGMLGFASDRATLHRAFLGTGLLTTEAIDA